MTIAARNTRAVARPSPQPFSTTPFGGAEEAWFWTMAALSARHCGLRASAGRAVRRPCDPDDVVNCLERLYQRGRISLAQARILRGWGERQQAPRQDVAAEREEARLWEAALGALDWPLRIKRIVA